MGGFSLGHWLVVLVIVLLLFGAGRLSDIGKGLGEGIKNFKKGLKEDEEAEAPPKPLKRKVVDAEEDDVEVVRASVPKALPAGKKKKVIQIEVDDDDDAEELARKIAAKKKAAIEAEDEPA